MTDKHAARLGKVQQTLLIPLYSRAVQTRAKQGLPHDPKAIEMIKAIDYDFAQFDDGPSPLGATLRTRIMDVWAREFLAAHPTGTVVEIGAMQTSPGPYFIVTEAVLAYLTETEVQHTPGLIAKHLPAPRIALDTAGAWIITNQHRHDTLKKAQARKRFAQYKLNLLQTTDTTP